MDDSQLSLDYLTVYAVISLLYIMVHIFEAQRTCTTFIGP